MRRDVHRSAQNPRLSGSRTDAGEMEPSMSAGLQLAFDFHKKYVEVARKISIAEEAAAQANVERAAKWLAGRNHSVS